MALILLKYDNVYILTKIIRKTAYLLIYGGYKMYLKRGFFLIWIFMVVIGILNISITIEMAEAQFYFPVTSGLSDFYNFGTFRYGALFGLSGTPPFMGANLYWGPNVFFGCPGGVFAGLYDIMWPFGSYLWPYYL